MGTVEPQGLGLAGVQCHPRSQLVCSQGPGQVPMDSVSEGPGSSQCHGVGVHLAGGESGGPGATAGRGLLVPGHLHLGGAGRWLGARWPQWAGHSLWAGLSGGQGASAGSPSPNPWPRVEVSAPKETDVSRGGSSG